VIIFATAVCSVLVATRMHWGCARAHQQRSAIGAQHALVTQAPTRLVSRHLQTGGIDQTFPRPYAEVCAVDPTLFLFGRSSPLAIAQVPVPTHHRSGFDARVKPRADSFGKSSAVRALNRPAGNNFFASVRRNPPRRHHGVFPPPHQPNRRAPR